ncbi:MAG: helix-turn-helix domain-containing protein [Pyrinomonadaceae bacterium]
MENVYLQDVDVRNHRLKLLTLLENSITAEIGRIVSTEGGSAPAREEIVGLPLSLDEQLRKLEIDLIRFALVQASGHQADAARLLSIKHSTLHEKIKRYGISVTKYRTPNDRSSSG